MCVPFSISIFCTENFLNFSSWIGSTQYALTILPGVVSGRLFDIGYLHIPMVVSSALMVASMCLVAECKQYWQILLTQGVIFGVRIEDIY
jgi:MFS transporter, MCT family, solute carrier family 16 (monocarboxylic acid transporters), member 10